jgi:beta propeller repeat protein
MSQNMCKWLICLLTFVVGLVATMLTVVTFNHNRLVAYAFGTQSPRWVEFQVTTGTIKPGSISIYKDSILWSQFKDCFYNGPYVPYPGGEWQVELPPEEPWNICLYDTIQQTITTAHSGGDLDNPELYGNWLVMDRNRFVGQVIAKNLETGEMRTIWGTFQHRAGPHIYKDLIVANPNTQTVEIYDLQADVYTTVVAFANATMRSDIYEEFVVWDQPFTFDYDIMGYNIKTQQYFTISAQPNNEVVPRIDNNIVVWSEFDNGNDVTAYDLTTDQIITITHDEATQESARISDNFIVWRDDRNGAWDIYAHDLSTATEYRVTAESDSTIRGLNIWGNLIVWERGEAEPNGQYASEIRAARLMSHFLFLPFIQQTNPIP